MSKLLRTFFLFSVSFQVRVHMYGLYMYIVTYMTIPLLGYLYILYYIYFMAPR